MAIRGIQDGDPEVIIGLGARLKLRSTGSYRIARRNSWICWKMPFLSPLTSVRPRFKARTFMVASPISATEWCLHGPGPSAILLSARGMAQSQSHVSRLGVPVIMPTVTRRGDPPGRPLPRERFALTLLSPRPRRNAHRRFRQYPKRPQDPRQIPRAMARKQGRKGLMSCRRPGFAGNRQSSPSRPPKAGRDGCSTRRGYRVRAEYARSKCAANEDCRKQPELDTPRACNLRDLRALFEGELIDD
jgi:hypothetical protein